MVVAQPDGEDPAAVEAHRAVVLAALGHLRDESLPLRGRAEGRSATLIAIVGISITKFSTTSVSRDINPANQPISAFGPLLIVIQLVKLMFCGCECCQCQKYQGLN